jgi:hypothetical protein
VSKWRNCATAELGALLRGKYERQERGEDSGDIAREPDEMELHVFGA